MAVATTYKIPINDDLLLLNDQIQVARRNLVIMRAQRNKIQEMYSLDLEELKRAQFKAGVALQKKQKKAKRAITEYATALQELNGSELQPWYLVSQQAQLCRCVHQIYTHKVQLQIEQKATADVRQSYQMAHDEVLRGKQTGEHVLMKKIVELDDQNQAQKVEYLTKVRSQQESIGHLKSKFLDLGINADVKEEEQVNFVGNFVRRVSRSLSPKPRRSTLSPKPRRHTKNFFATTEKRSDDGGMSLIVPFPESGNFSSFVSTSTFGRRSPQPHAGVA